MSNVTNFTVGTITYLPGDIVEILDSQFSANFMEKVEELKLVETPKAEVDTVEPAHTGGPKLEDLPKSKARRLGE